MAAGLATSVVAQPNKVKPASKDVLGPGAYQATVKAIVCDGCGEYIQKTMAAQLGIGAVVVDQKAKLVTFRVIDGANVKVAQLQMELGKSAEQMGMGADYTLENIKSVSAKSSAPQIEKTRMTESHEGHQH